MISSGGLELIQQTIEKCNDSQPLINCVVWPYGKASNNKDGYEYAQQRIKKKRYLVHRYIIEIIRNPIPNNYFSKNTCGNTLCINPYHWDLMTKEGFYDHMFRLSPRRPKVTNQIVIQIYIDNNWRTYQELAERYNVSTNIIANIKKRKTWRRLTSSYTKGNRRSEQVS